MIKELYCFNNPSDYNQVDRMQISTDEKTSQMIFKAPPGKLFARSGGKTFEVQSSQREQVMSEFETQFKVGSLFTLIES